MILEGRISFESVDSDCGWWIELDGSDTTWGGDVRVSRCGSF